MCTGLDSSIEGEEAGGALAGGGGSIGKQGDRENIDLPINQQEYIEKLIKIGKKVVLLNFSGGCINFGKFKNRVNAILQCWYPGAQGGKAIADILFGKCSPSGKLPITFTIQQMICLISAIIPCKTEPIVISKAMFNINLATAAHTPSFLLRI